MNDLLGRFQIFWDGLASRERVLLGIAGGILAIFLLFFGLISPLQSWVSGARNEANDAERELVMMERMKHDWDGLHGRLDEVEQRIQSVQSRQSLLTLLESLAARAGVKPTSMEKRQSGESERYKETKVEVSLKNVTLQQAVDYLSSIERADQPLSVKSLRVKRRENRARGGNPKGPDLIDVTFSVSAFKPIS